MADQQLIPVAGMYDQGVSVQDDTSMNGSNGSPIIVEHLEDRIGPTEDAPSWTFYIYAPTLHWHTSLTTDKSTRRAIE